jgi:hypothetical protein
MLLGVFCSGYLGVSPQDGGWHPFPLIADLIRVWLLQDDLPGRVGALLVALDVELPVGVEVV